MNQILYTFIFSLNFLAGGQREVKVSMRLYHKCKHSQ
uniref:Uncharacterized protein n=1 Tax=Rhizophora mucronata TaxID=61149 RepID=A0A2P2NDK6_RHIMU